MIYEENQDFASAESVLLKLAGDYPDNYRVYKRLAFLEADRQQHLDNTARDYSTMKGYYLVQPAVIAQRCGTQKHRAFLQNCILRQIDRPLKMLGRLVDLFSDNAEFPLRIMDRVILR